MEKFLLPILTGTQHTEELLTSLGFSVTYAHREKAVMSNPELLEGLLWGC